MEKIIRVLSDYENWDSSFDNHKLIANKILLFLEKLHVFDYMMKNESADTCDLQILGKELNDLRNDISTEIDNNFLHNSIKVSTIKFETKIYEFGLRCLPAYSSIPANLLVHLIPRGNNIRSIDTRSNFYDAFFVFDLWKNIYEQNDIDGLSKYVALDNKLNKNMDMNIADLYLNEYLEKEMILNLISPENELGETKSTNQACAIKYYCKSNKGNERILNNNSKRVINL